MASSVVERVFDAYRRLVLMGGDAPGVAHGAPRRQRQVPVGDGLMVPVAERDRRRRLPMAVAGGHHPAARHQRPDARLAAFEAGLRIEAEGIHFMADTGAADDRMPPALLVLAQPA